jgi:hypothetical protein
MDLIAFGLVCLLFATAGFFVSLILGIRGAVASEQERRYLARTARRTLGRPPATTTLTRTWESIEK